MATGFWARCRVREAAVWLALALAICLTVTSTAPAMAENNSVSLFLKKKNAAPAQGNWQNPANTGKAVTTTEIIADGKASPFLMPDSASQMQGALNRYLAIKAAGGWPTVGTGKYKKGSESKAVAVLNKRLYIEGYVRKEATEGEFAARFTSATEDAVKRFQRNHGLAVTGTVGDATAKELNVPVDKRIATIRANLPRLAEYSKDLGARYVTVNVPAMQIETVGGGRVYSRHNAIVGRPSANARGHDGARHHQVQPLLERAGLDHREGHHPAHDFGWPLEGAARHECDRIPGCRRPRGGPRYG